jgi:hypothetical protein
MAKLEAKIQGIDTTIDDLDSDAEDADGSVIGLTHNQRITKDDAYSRRDAHTTNKKRLKAKIIEHFDDTLGGMKSVSKYDKTTLKLPKNFEKTSPVYFDFYLLSLKVT